MQKYKYKWKYLKVLHSLPTSYKYNISMHALIFKIQYKYKYRLMDVFIQILPMTTSISLNIFWFVQTPLLNSKFMMRFTSYFSSIKCHEIFKCGLDLSPEWWWVKVWKCQYFHSSIMTNKGLEMMVHYKIQNWIPTTQIQREKALQKENWKLKSPQKILFGFCRKPPFDIVLGASKLAFSRPSNWCGLLLLAHISTPLENQV